MRNICNEEKNLKRYLKNHISLNLETMVKFLITGMVGFSLTACGGGGGGGSSSNPTPPVVGPEDPKPEPPVTPPPVVEEEVNTTDKTHQVENSNSIVTGTITGTKDNFVGLKAVNSTVENKAKISIEGNNAVGIHGTMDSALFNARANHVVTNSGTITISGHEAIGMLVENGVLGINNGEIIATSKAKDLIGTKEKVDEDGYKTIYKYYKTYDWVEGMRAQSGGEIQNTGKIAINGMGTAMIAESSKAINDGILEGESGDQQYILEEYDDEGKLYHSEEGVTKEYIAGMIGYNEATIVNGKNGTISLTGEAEGIFIKNNSTALNEGQIEISSGEKTYKEKHPTYVYNPETGKYDKEEWVESKVSFWTEITGMKAEENSKIINEGKITFLGEGKGMVGEISSEVINNGDIYGKSDFLISSMVDSEGNEIGNKSIYLTEIVGIEVSGNSYAENNGLISLSGEAEGMIATEKSEIVNNGTIQLEDVVVDSEEKNLSDLLGMCVNDSKGINNGLISINGNTGHGVTVSNGDFKNSSSGKIEIDAVSGATAISANAYNGSTSIKNNGVISVSAKEYVVGIMGYADFSDNLEIENSGLINVAGNFGIGIELNNGNINNIGKIIVSGDDTIGIKSNSEGDSTGKNILINDGLIAVNGKSGDDYYNSHIPTGIQAFNYIENNKGLITNNGKIEIESSDDARGIDAYGNDVINNGVINIKGNGLMGGFDSAAIRVQGLGATATNNGTINVDGTGTWGMYAGGDGTAINAEDGIINVSATAEGAMVASGGNAINYGTINMTSEVKDEPYTFERPGDMNENSLIKITYEKTFDEVIAMKGQNRSTIENNKEINIDGFGTGMISWKNSKAINNDEINLISGKNNGSFEYYENDKLINSTTGEMYQQMTGILADDNSTIENGDSGKISIKGEGNAMVAINSSKATNNGDISLESVEYEGSSTWKEEWGGIEEEYSETGIKYTRLQGIYIEDNSEAVNNKNIYLTGHGNGIMAIKNSLATNNGDIRLEAKYEILGETEDKEIIYKGAPIAGMVAYNSQIINNGLIEHLNDGQGMKAIDNSIAINNGDIVMSSKEDWNYHVIAMELIESKGENNGDIVIVGNAEHKAITLENSDFINKGSIEVENHGMFAMGIVSYKNTKNKTIVNEGSIKVFASENESDPSGFVHATGVSINGGNFVNKGYIEAKAIGGKATGIRIYGKDSTATNLGTINIDGEGSFGMYAENGATITNGVTGVINVGASAAGGMYADSSSTAINDGTINIHKDNVGGESIALVGNGMLINNGTVTADTDLTINSIKGGTYVIGTSEDGSYGKISAKNVSIDGDIVVSAGITKNGFKNEYTMQNVVDAEDIKLGDNFNFTSNSLLYDASAVTDRWGNLDATLSRNDKTLSDFTTGYITSTANIFGKYQNEDSFKTLSSDAKEVIKAIDTSSVESINETLNGLTPTIYANLGRQILETSETFKEQDMVAINSLGENSYNFTFIGEYQDVDSRDNIEGYKSKMSGFVGAMNFGDGTFGTIGYGYNAVDYKDNGKGHIQTIHLGLNRLGKYEGVDYKFGIGGEYNFHENKRDIDLLGRRAESDFDSYGVRASGEVSKVFGEKAYVKPYLGLDLAHMKYDSFTESNANSLNANVESENYTSVLPKVGFVVGDRFYGLDLFAGVEYSYELGNMDKEQNFSYEGFEGTGKLPKDGLECGTTGVKAGASYEVNNFTLGASVGKNFGRRDNSFVNMSLGYRF